MSDFRTDSQIVKAASGVQHIEQNAADDWSLIIVSAAQSTRVTILRLKGTSAEADIQVYLQLWKLLGEATMNVHW